MVTTLIIPSCGATTFPPQPCAYTWIATEEEDAQIQPTMATNQAPVGTLVSPRLVRMDQSSTDDLECSLHYLPKPLLREFSHVFNDEYLKFGDNSSTMEMDTTGDSSSSSSSALKLLAIPTNQKAREDLVAVGDHIEQEKERLLNVVRIPHDRLFYLLMQND